MLSLGQLARKDKTVSKVQQEIRDQPGQRALRGYKELPGYKGTKELKELKAFQAKTATRERPGIRESRDPRATRVLKDFKDKPVIQDQEESETLVGAVIKRFKEQRLHPVRPHLVKLKCLRHRLVTF